MQEKIKEQILASASMKEAMVISCIEDIESAANLMIHSIRNSGKILWCGNGGSAGKYARASEGNSHRNRITVFSAGCRPRFGNPFSTRCDRGGYGSGNDLFSRVLSRF